MGLKSILTILIVLFVLLQYRLWLGTGGLVRLWQINQAVEQQLQENNRLEERNLALEAEVIDLKRGLEAVEERARSELGMIKKGETFVQIVTPASNSGGGE
ncbi:MAG TPA: cell division protein FtsB [Ectothiorhodospiraceae bacterium]|nr:cell division protein FtsB [Ectothiorhodospiraceae bacterium]